ncbi:MAG TPA: diguanylate cyclase [Ktedonobacteraceae bacterium]
MFAKYMPRDEKDSGLACVPWQTMGMLFVLSVVLVAINVVKPFGSAVDMYVFCAFSILYPMLITALCLKDSLRIIRHSHSVPSGAHPGRRFSPLLLGLNVFVFACAQITAVYYFLFHGHEVPFLSVPYYMIFGCYLFFVCAILFLPTHKVSPLARLRILLDSLIIIAVVATLCAYFVLAPMLSRGEGTQMEKIIGTLFPTLDLMLLFCVFLVALRFEDRALRPAVILLSLASFSMFLIHINRLSLVLIAHQHWFSNVGLGWLFGLIFLYGGTQALKNIQQQDPAAANAGEPCREHLEIPFPYSRGGSLVSLVLVLGVCVLIFALWLAGVEKIFQGQLAIIYVGDFAILMLVVLRQLLALYEIGFLQNKLQKRNRSLSLLNDMLEQQAITDPLTGLPNHRALMERLRGTVEGAWEKVSTCALIFMDLDHFKDINDCYGHLVGDAVLCECSERMMANLRTSDYLGRWGGEEFVAVLPGMEPGEALGVAGRIRAAIARGTFAEDARVSLTCSFGVATYPHDATNCEDLIRNADLAMYTAKRLGRNQTRMASEPLVLAMGMLAEEPKSAREAEMLAVVESLIVALEARDQATGQHARRVATLSLKLALALGCHWPEACIIGMGGLMHDLGKVAMPDSILFKKGKLSAAEIEYMARHPVIGEEILASLPAFHEVAAIVRSHHEWFNGSGYPDSLSREQIPLGARIVAVADAYDAIISHRVYRQGRGSSEATRELGKGAGEQFDPRVVDALDHLLATSPHLIMK